jgi:DNA-binding MarR family transcriptional regulator
MKDDTDPLSDIVFHRFLSLIRYSRQHARQLSEEQGVKPREYSVLRLIYESGPATVGQVQAYLHNSPSTTSSLISQLEKMGYVTRIRMQADNRVVIVELTQAGQDIAENTPLGGLPLLHRRLSSLSETRLAEIDSALTEISHLMEVGDSK